MKETQNLPRKRLGGFMPRQLTQIFAAILVACLTLRPTKVSAACSNSKTYCSSSKFDSTFTCDYEGFNIRYEWEMFEGSIALSQHGLFWKEITKKDTK